MKTFPTTLMAGSSIKAGLRSVWEFEEASGSFADSKGSFTLTASNMTYQQTGKTNYCAYSGASGYAYQSGVFNSSDSQGTISLWYYNPGAGGGALFSQTSYSTAYFQIGDDGSGSTFTVKHKSAGGSENSIRAGTWSLSAWYHLVVTSNGSTWKIYTAATERTPTVTSGSNNGDWFADWTAGSSPYVGVWCQANLDGYNYQTPYIYIDQLAIWSRVLTQAEITWLYNSGSGRAYSTWA